MMPPYNDHHYILRVVDHLSKFGYVYPIKQRTEKEVRDGLLCILSTSIMPKILQSDNGGRYGVHEMTPLQDCHSDLTLYFLIDVSLQYSIQLFSF
jgi:hypothetical protein